ncbi:MAG: hypothetical protein M3N52_02525 [Actinomycetota bacterium]|nr:hypothetical protein [Actinomycetota bacterium]
MRGAELALLPAGVALAILVEWRSFDAGDSFAVAVADGIVGAVLLSAAIVAWERRPGSRVGPLMGLAGLTWFAGTLWAGVLLVHRGPLVHLHLSYPTGRLRWRPALVTVAVVYVVAVVEPFADDDRLTLVVAAAVTAVAAGAFLRTTGTARRAGIPAFVAAVAFAGALSLGAVTRLAGWQVDSLWAYNLVVFGAVVILLVDLLRGRWADAVVTGLVVDLGHRTDTGSLRDGLARALGDPTLTVGYWLPGERRYVDEAGEPLELDERPDGRVVTPVDHRGEPLAVLVHDVAVLDDGALVESVTAAARLAVANARLQADTRERVVAIATSRRRLVEAAELQRRRLSLELRDEVHCRLDRVAQLLAEARRASNGDHAPFEAVDAELRSARAELDHLAQGLYPTPLTDGGLAAALPVLAGRSVTPVTLDVAAARLAPGIEAAIYFFCAEALTNVAKYADASRVSISVACAGGDVTAVVQDDGRGGADPGRGTGLRGLTDRIEAFGGRLDIVTGAGRGTCLMATIPVGET